MDELQLSLPHTHRYRVPTPSPGVLTTAGECACGATTGPLRNDAVDDRPSTWHGVKKEGRAQGVYVGLKPGRAA